MYIDSDVEENSRMLDFFSLKRSDCPKLCLMHLTKDMTKYVPENNKLDAASITTFVQNYLGGKLKVSVIHIYIIDIDIE